MECKRKIDVKLKQRSSESNGNNTEINALTSQAPNAKARLPKLSLPKFRGDVSKWPRSGIVLIQRFTRTEKYLTWINSII